MKTEAEVIVVIRVSTDAQDTQRQFTDTQRVIQAHNLRVARTIELEGVSGRHVMDDPQIKAMLRDLQRPDVLGICVSALDRLFRLDRYQDFGILDFFKDSGKKIFSAKEGPLDLQADSGFLVSMMSGAAGGLEWRELRRRTMQGKAEKRREGWHVDGGQQTLPRGVLFTPILGPNGRKTGGAWSYTEPEASRIRKAYDLLFERRSFNDIASRIGGGFTDKGIAGTLRNPIWKGVRQFKDGAESFEKRVISKPLISPARWEAAQQIILEKKSNWRKTKHPPRFLISGLATCGCGKPCYLRVGGTPRRANYYFCSTRFPGRGPACGAGSVRQDAADQAVVDLVSGPFLDAAFWRGLLQRVETRIPARVSEQAKLDRERAKLEAERQKLLRLVLKGLASEEDFARESKRIEGELRDMDRLATAPAAVDFNPGKLIVNLSQAFAEFAKQPFQERREMLQAAVKEFVLEDGGISGLTLNGSFLEGVNSRAQSKLRCSRRYQALGKVLRRS